MGIFGDDVTCEHAAKMSIFSVLSCFSLVGAFSMIYLGLHTNLLNPAVVVPMSTFAFFTSAMFFAAAFHVHALSSRERLRREKWHADAVKRLQAQLEAAHQKSLAKVKQKFTRHNIVGRAAALYRHEGINSDSGVDAGVGESKKGRGTANPLIGEEKKIAGKKILPT